MSQENVDLVHRAYDAIDLDAFLALHDPECVIAPRIVSVEGRDAYRGHDGLRAFWTDINVQARKVWIAAGLEPITLHEARHCAASFFIAAGLNIKAVSTFMGHASVAITLDRYSKLLPGGEDEAADLLDAFFERANTQARVAAVSG